MPNGNYVVNTFRALNDRGAVTWGNGNGGTFGTVSASNSLIGGINGDFIGSGGVTVLTNGNYVVNSPSWRNGSYLEAGAVTWADASTGVSGAISASNSLVGNRQQARTGAGGVTALSNGNYTVSTPDWTMANYSVAAGAVTWGDGRRGITDTISPANSLIGKYQNVQIGSGGVTALSNGNYVVSSPYWSDTGVINAGAVTWCNGAAPTSDSVKVSNSLVGTYGDYVGAAGVVALTNGNYVVISPFWNNGTITTAGAITWCVGTGMTSDTVSAANSLVGSSVDDQLGLSLFYNPEVIPLTNGNYVVNSSMWDNGSIRDAGAVTFCNGSTGISGTVTSANSLTGDTEEDKLGSGFVGGGYVEALPGGHYLVRSDHFDNGALTDAGAITWGNGSTGVMGSITVCNSVVGNSNNGFLGIWSAFYDSVSGQLVIGKRNDNEIVVFNPCGQRLASVTTSDSYTLAGNSTAPFVSGDCQIISALRAAGANPVSGDITSTVYIAGSAIAYQGQPLVRRHYDLSPANNPNTATALVTLYFSQSDFDDYNSNNGSGADLPTSPSDAAGISALRIAQFHGTSITGDPGSYSGWSGSGPAVITIDPADSNLAWNSSESRWELDFDITGFSGFFVFTGNPLGANGAIHSAEVRIMPVPATDNISITNTDAALLGTTGVISDLQGRELHRFILGATTRIDIGAWPAGMYTLKLQSGKVLRFVKR